MSHRKYGRWYVTFLLLCVFVLYSISYADVTPVADRTPQVRDAIVAAVPGVDSAADVTAEHLSTMTSLTLRLLKITSLASGDFSGLTGMTSLNLYGNQLSSLPAGIFEGLTSLTTLRLGRNAVDPLPLTVSLEKVAEGEFKAVVPAGATFDIVLPITVANGSITGGTTALTISQGGTESSLFEVTRTPGTTGEVTVDIGTLPSLPRNHYGYELVKSDALLLTIIGGINTAPTFAEGNITIRTIAENVSVGTNIGAPITATDVEDDTLTWTLGGVDADSFEINSTTGQLKTKAPLDYETKRVYSVSLTVADEELSDTITVIISVIDVSDTVVAADVFPVVDRTPQVRDAIVAAIPTVRDATQVTATHLASITSLNLRSKGISALKIGDFSGLVALTNLNLFGNQLSSLPVGTFDGLGALTTLRLGGNVVDPLPLIVSLQQVRDSEYRAIIPTGAPFPIRLPITVTDSSISGGITSVVISQGRRHSAPFTVVGTSAKVSIGMLPGVPRNHYGYVLAQSTVSSRTEQVATAIAAAIGVSDSRSVTEIDLATITSLDLSGTSLTTLKTGDFADMVSLTTLNLSNNALTYLPADIFDDTPSLRSITLANNQLSSLPVGLFTGLSFLSTVDLSGNGITSLSDGTFSELSTLTTLNLSNNKMSTLPAGIFEGLTSLNQLSLSGNTVDPLQIGVSLQKVGINQFKAVALTGAPFNIVLPLERINGTVRGVATTIQIPKGSVESQPLTMIRMPNTIAAVEVDIVNVPQLPSNHNGYALVKSMTRRLEVLPILNSPPVFTEGTSTTRNIAENTAAGTNIGDPVSATDVDEDTLTYRIGGTDAAAFAIDTSSGQLRTSAILDYENKNSYSITVSVSDGNGGSDSITVTITVTDVSETKITPAISDRTPQVRDAIVAAASVSSAADVNAAHLTAIRTLDLLDHSISSLKAGDFSGLTSLIWIDLSSNSISDISALEDLTSLETLRLYDNSISDISVLSGLTSLTTLNLSGNSIGDISALSGLTSLTTLNLSINSISDISALSGLTSLTRLGLRGNSISDYGPLRRLLAAIEAAGNSLSLDTTIPLVGNNNDAPIFTDGTSTTRSIVENTGSGVNIGPAVSATDADNDTLTYTLIGTDASSFSIVSSSGQLQTKASLDYENKNSYSVTISVSDSNGGTDSITVTINVTDVSETTITLVSERTSQVRDAIVAALRGVSSAADVTAAHLTTITSLDLSDQSISSLKPGDFSGLSSLTTLRLYDNSISDISALSGLTSLTTLNLSGNSISDISALSGLTSLTRLNLSINSINDISVLSGLTSLTRLNLSINSISDISALSGLTSLTRLGLRGNSISDYGPLRRLLAALEAAGNSLSLDTTIPPVRSNNNAPVFTDGTSTTRSVAENSGSGVNIGSVVSATDADNDTLTYTLIGTDASSFSIISSSGQLQTKASLDYENKNSYTVTVSVSDGNGGTDSITVTINVTDVSETTITLVSERTSQVRDAIVAALHGVSSAADVTAAHLTAITSLDLSDQSISSLKPGDFSELTSLTTLNLSYNSIGDISALEDLTSLTTLNLAGNSISDISILSGLTSLTRLNLSINSISDISALENLTSLTRLNLSDNSISDISALENLTSLTRLGLRGNSISDYGPLRRLLAALEAAGNSLSLDTTIPSVRSNNNAPVFTDGTSTTRHIPENSGSGVNIGSAVSATDADNDTLTYTLIGTDASSFSVVSSSGQLQTKASLDYENKNSYTVTVSVSDGKSGTDSITVTINVTDVSDTPLTSDSERTPQVRDAIVAAAGVASATDVTTTHLATITSLDLSNLSIGSLKAGDFSGLTSLTWLDLSDNSISDISALEDLTSLETLHLYDNSISDISALSGLTSLTTLNLADNSISDISALEDLTSLTKLGLRGNSISDYGPLRRLLAALEATGNSLSLDTTIPPVRSNNNAPVFTDGTSTTRFVVENTGSGVNIGSAVSATDADNDTLAYTLIGTDASSFSIVGSSGQLLTKATLDYEKKVQYSVTVKVSDGKLTDTITVTINVTDVQENRAPLFSADTATRSVAENTAAGQNIGAAITATDSDNDNLTYTLEGTDASSFSIVSSSGQLLTKATLDYEKKVQYSVTVKVSDGKLTDTITVTINVTDVQENRAPLFSADTATRSVAENTAAGQNIGAAITATDSDNDNLTYTLEGTDASSFSIVSSSGQLLTKATLNFESKSSYEVTVSVSDGNGGSDSITVTINVADVNENQPVFSDGASTTRSIAENTVAGQNIGDPVSATDADTGDTLTYSLGGTDASSFDIISTSGQLQTKVALDYEGSKNSYTVTVSVSDGKGGTDKITVSIIVTDVTETTTAPQIQITPVGKRTSQVRDAIVADISGVSSAEDVTEAHLTTITSLDLSNQSISSLKAGDFSGLTSLTHLRLYNNSISDISALSDLTSLTWLFLSNNSISDISALSGLTKLTRLTLYDNSVSDISALLDLTSLTWLHLYDNSISDISALSALTELTWLELGENSISDISALSALTDLRSLNLYNNTISDISALSGMTKMTDLYLSKNSISDISALSGMTKMTTLYLSNNSISDISDLEDLTKLTTLYLSNNSISDISALSGMTKMTWLFLSNNSISDISDLEDLTKLTTLYLSNNSISDISALEDLTKLTWLQLDGNSISDYGPLGRLKAAIEAAGNSLSLDITIPADAPSHAAVPKSTSLLPNFPNPFNPETWIPYQLAKPSAVTITIFDVRGRVVRTLILGTQPSGIYRSQSKAAHWDGKNAFGEKVAGGMYFYRLTAGDFSATRKMLILK